MPGIQRIFLDWTTPALPIAADWLLTAAPSPGNLSGCIVVVPGGRAGRRLLEILVARCTAAEVGLSPPQIVTMGALPELLYVPKLAFADDLTQRLAWVQALQHVAAQRKHREAIQQFFPAFPSSGDVGRLLELADLLRRQHTELAADGLDFSSVAEQTDTMEINYEAQRWRLMQVIQRAYLDVLDRLSLWDKQTARLIAIDNKECQTEKQVVLLGTVDMNRTARQMLDQVAESVTALIVAPEEVSDRFDQHGCVLPGAWTEADVPVDEQRVVLADDPLDQADETARAIARFDGRYRGDEITIGVCDDRIVPQITRQLEQCELTARWGPGRSITQTPPYRLLRGLSDYLERRSWYDFAALIRHPDIEAWLNRKTEIQSLACRDWLTALDKYQSAHVQTRLAEQWLGAENERTKDQVAAVQAVYNSVAALLEGLGDEEQSLCEWPQRVSQLLLDVYAERQFDQNHEDDRISLAALEKLHAALMDQRQVPADLAPAITVTDCLRWTLDAVSGETIAPPPDPSAIEVLGWLELALDDAPALVVTSLNEGFVPVSTTGDMFLPDSLRTQLGLDDNARRYAREAFALSVLAASRDAWFIVGRRDGDDNPLAPSRLLFACDDESLVRRAQKFFTPPAGRAGKQPLAGTSTPVLEQANFTVPRPLPLREPPGKLRVTAFRDYLACPYRFYLKQVVGIEGVDDAADELDGGKFGGLAHEVLNRFGRDERRHTTSAEEIAALLDEFLAEMVAETFGAHPRPAVAVQIEQLGRRLNALADIQAARAAAGWRILYTEVPTEETPCQMIVDGDPFTLTGRIDRIDFHEASGAWAIWDYKTSDTAKKPAATHRKQDAWIDLQLPLYRFLAAEVDERLKSILHDNQMIELGYIQIPKSVDGVKFEPAEWTLAELDSAEETAHQVIRSLREQAFWPPADPPPEYSEDFAGICLDGVFGRAPLSPSPAGRGPG